MILILGPPGAGKSVQAELLDDEGRVQWFSVGKLIRDHTDALPEDVKADVATGKLIDDNLVSEVLKEAIEKADSEPVILIDGFPRRQSQVTWLEKYLKSTNRKITRIIHLKLPEKVSIERLKKRGRLDDTEEIVKRRYKQYENEALRVISVFSGEGVPVLEIDGDNSVEAIHKQIITSM